MEYYGVPNLINEIKKSGIENYHLSILDQKVPDFESLEKTLTWIEDSQSKKKNLLVHCVGGLGRTGTILACFLVKNINSLLKKQFNCFVNLGHSEQLKL